MDVYVVSHREAKIISTDYLKPLHVGSIGQAAIPGYARDDCGDNISDRNYSYCELTGLYWIWKNTVSDVAGLCHYRRYFSPFELPKGCFFGDSFETIETVLKNDPLGVGLNVGGADTDIIVARKYDLKTFIDRSHIENTRTRLNSVWFVMLNALYNAQRGEFYEARDFFSSESFLYPCNMFIAKRKVINEYCEWLFSILFEFEKLMAFYPKEEMERTCGYLGEMLFTWWVHSRKLAVSTRPVFFVVDA